MVVRKTEDLTGPAGCVNEGAGEAGRVSNPTHSQVLTTRARRRISFQVRPALRDKGHPNRRFPKKGLQPLTHLQ